MEIISHGAVKNECLPSNNLNVLMNFDIVNFGVIMYQAQGSVTGEAGLFVAFSSILAVTHGVKPLLYLLHIHVQIPLTGYVGII